MVARIDTVGVSFPIIDADVEGATVQVTGYGTPAESVRYRRALKLGGFMAWGVNGTCWVEASLPKRGGGDNVEGVTAEEAVDLVREMIGEACNYVDMGVPLGDGPTERRHDHVMTGVRHGSNRFARRHWHHAQVKRLDVVRDFDGVTHIGSLLDGLATIKTPGRGTVRRFADAQRGQAQTLRVGPKSWGANLYDKHAETPRMAAPGRLRFEARMRDVQLRGKRLQLLKANVHNVEQLTQEKVERMTESTFHHFGFDREVAGAAQVGQAIANATDELGDPLSARVRRDLVGYLAARAMGVDLDFSPNTERKYRQLAERLGLVLSPDSLGESFTARLDYETGAQVLAAA